MFIVPQTHDMVSQLLSPSQPKNLSDLVVLGVLALHILIFAILSPPARIPAFALAFLFWRTCYNGGIGYLLYVQSHHRRLVCWARRYHLLVDPATGQKSHPTWHRLIKRELETKIPEDYNFDEAPIEYNTWLVFRRVVDLILMCDFVSYCLFAIACGTQPPQESVVMMLARWSAGIGLVGFNLWVKLDAHRVVKDFAWYWGDFFYLIEQELTFDGVFEMAPHPMYSVGYAGYYGISLMAASYRVLLISIIAHAAQFTFLYVVENPHIEKTYNPPPSRTQAAGAPSEEVAQSDEDGPHKWCPEPVPEPGLTSSLQPSRVHKQIGLRSIDLRRVSDVSVLLLQCYMLALLVSTPSTTFFQGLFVAHAALWRLWFSAGLGVILRRQSNQKRWTRHYLKFGESTQEAWRQWKGMYHLSLTMCYASFTAAAWKMYAAPTDWQHGYVLLKHVVGMMLVALQVWTAVSIYTSLGEFGWFYGDFFFDQAPKLTYGGIYRYLNNPERVIGLAGVWGAVLITGSPAILGLALFSHILTLCFIDYVERPHMQKLYGRKLRREAGLVKSLRRSLPPQLRQWHGSVDRVLGEAADFVDDFIDSAQPKFAAGVVSLVKDTQSLFRQYPARITLTRLAPDLAGYNPRDYLLDIAGTPLGQVDMAEWRSAREREDGQLARGKRDSHQTLIYAYATPIKVRWSAPVHHSKRDWVALYQIADNASREVTRVSSAGRWIATNPGAYDSADATRGLLVSHHYEDESAGREGADGVHCWGEMLFSGNKLWWTPGVFEFRYHHDGKHNVMAISLPFEVRVPRFDEDQAEVDGDGTIRGSVEKALLPVVQNCFDRDLDIAPSTVDEGFGALVERDGKFAKRVVLAVHQMYVDTGGVSFGV